MNTTNTVQILIASLHIRDAKDAKYLYSRNLIDNSELDAVLAAFCSCTNFAGDNGACASH
jgi:hypothetical protein